MLFGPLQILISLLTLILVFTGVQIFQTAYVAEDGPKRTNGMVVGGTMLLLAVIVGGFAMYHLGETVKEFRNLP